MTITLPVDFTESLEFRRLSGVCRSKNEALCIFMSVFQNLGYLVREGNPPGRISKSDIAIFCKDLEIFVLDGIEPEKMFNDLAESAKLLVKDGDDFFCPMFERYNRPGSTGVAMNSHGGKIRAYESQLKKSLDGNLQGSLALPSSILVDGENGNKPLDSDMVKRVRDLIVRCDLALSKRSRPDPLYTAELIQNSLMVCKRFTDEQIAAICRIIVKHRASARYAGHSALLGMTTEKMLPRFGELEGMLEGGGS